MPNGVTFKRPVLGFVTSPFGMRGGKLHAGLDIAAPIGAVIVAAADGIVEVAAWNGGYGNYVRLNHGKLGAGGVLTTAYGHMSKIECTVGQRVTGGQLIGRVGSTGDSTGPHCHFEVRINGNPTDPAPWLSGAQTVALQAAALTVAPVGVVSDTVGAIQDIAGLVKSITDGSLWIRLIMIVAGFIFILFAVLALIGKSKSGQVINLVSQGAKKASSASAGEAVVTGAS